MYLSLVVNTMRKLKEEGQKNINLSSKSLEILYKWAKLQTCNDFSEHFISEENENTQIDKISFDSNETDILDENMTKNIKTDQKSIDSKTKNSEFPKQPDKIQLPNGSKQEKWEWLKNYVLNCPICNKHVYPGKKIVFGSGNLDADIVFCGEAPGSEEEEKGEVFVGRAGQLLTKIIEAMGFSRSDVYIGNIMNWRPEMPERVGNRPPTKDEMNFCLPYLKAQVEIVSPKTIIALGATAVSGLLGKEFEKIRMRDLRGQVFDFFGTPCMVTFHPSYLLRNNTKMAKRTVWEDMLKVMELLKYPISEKQRGFFL